MYLYLKDYHIFGKTICIYQHDSEHHEIIFSTNLVAIDMMHICINVILWACPHVPITFGMF